MSLAWFESTRGLRVESKRRKENRRPKETLFGYFFDFCTMNNFFESADAYEHAAEMLVLAGKDMHFSSTVSSTLQGLPNHRRDSLCFEGLFCHQCQCALRLFHIALFFLFHAIQHKWISLSAPQ